MKAQALADEIKRLAAEMSREDVEAAMQPTYLNRYQLEAAKETGRALYAAIDRLAAMAQPQWQIGAVVCGEAAELDLGNPPDTTTSSTEAGGHEMNSPTKPALPEPVAYLHDVVAADGEPDQALSFSPDNFPLAGVGGFRSVACTALYTQAAIDAAVADYAQALSSALGWPGGISDPVLDWPTLLRYVAEARAVPADWADQIEHRLLTWRQRTMNRSGDRLALNDFMGQDSIDDLIDFVCAPLDCGEAGHDEGRCGNASCLAATPSPAEQPRTGLRTVTEAAAAFKESLSERAAERPKLVDEAACRAQCDYCGDDWPCAKQRADEKHKPAVLEALAELEDAINCEGFGCACAPDFKCATCRTRDTLDKAVRKPFEQLRAALSGEQP